MTSVLLAVRDDIVGARGAEVAPQHLLLGGRSAGREGRRVPPEVSEVSLARGGVVFQIRGHSDREVVEFRVGRSSDKAGQTGQSLVVLGVVKEVVVSGGGVMEDRSPSSEVVVDLGGVKGAEFGRGGGHEALLVEGGAHGAEVDSGEMCSPRLTEASLVMAGQ